MRLDANFTGRRASSDESNLLTKLDAACAKINHDKYTDTEDKLMEISDKATTLADPTRGKSKLDDATDINTTASDTIVCVSGLSGDTVCSAY